MPKSNPFALETTSSSDWASEDPFLAEIIETQNDLAAVELDAHVIMRTVAERTRKLTGADGVAINLLEGQELLCHAAAGVSEGNVGIRLPVKGSLSGASIIERKTLYSPDCAQDERVFQEPLRKCGGRSLICVPIIRGSEAIGALNVISLTPNAFEPRHVVALRLMGGVIAAALLHAAEFDIKRKLLSERTRALAALRESEERFRSAFEHAAIGMALVALDGRWLQVNRSICDIVGYTEAEMLVRDFQSITHPDDLETDLEYVRQLIAGDIRDYQMTKRYLHKRRHVVWVQLSVSLVRDENGNPLYFISQIQDISARQHAEEALRQSEEAHRATFDLAGVGLAHTDLHTGRFLRVNRKLCELTGYTPDELHTMTFYQITHPDDVESNRDAIQRMRDGGIAAYVAEKRYIRKDGHAIWVSLNARVIRDPQGKPMHSVAITEDITRRKQLEWLEHDRGEVLEMVAQDRPIDDILDRLTHLVERQLECFAAIIRLENGKLSIHAHSLPTPVRDALRRAPLRLAAALASGCGGDDVGVSDISIDPVWTEAGAVMTSHGLRSCFTTPLRSADGTVLGVLLLLTRGAAKASLELDHLLAAAGKLATIAIGHHESASLLAHAVRHDPLTGLPNRVLFEDRLQQALASARRGGKIVALFAVDLDRFKQINDTHGHHAGDALLQQFAMRVRSLLRETDTMARMGGDEFLVLLPEMASAEGASRVAGIILQSMSEPFTLAGQAVTVSCSIGIALCPQDGANGVTLQARADAALYDAKDRGRNTFAFAS